jgi:hypothetical protein
MLLINLLKIDTELVANPPTANNLILIQHEIIQIKRLYTLVQISLRKFQRLTPLLLSRRITFII